MPMLGAVLTPHPPVLLPEVAVAGSVRFPPPARPCGPRRRWPGGVPMRSSWPCPIRFCAGTISTLPRQRRGGQHVRLRRAPGAHRSAIRRSAAGRDRAPGPSGPGEPAPCLHGQLLNFVQPGGLAHHRVVICRCAPHRRTARGSAGCQREDRPGQAPAHHRCSPFATPALRRGRRESTPSGTGRKCPVEDLRQTIGRTTLRFGLSVRLFYASSTMRVCRGAQPSSLKSENRQSMRVGRTRIRCMGLGSFRRADRGIFLNAAWAL